MQALCAKYGTNRVLAAGDALQDHAQRKMRAGIAAIPDGTYSFTDRFDSTQFDGEMELKVDITVTGESVHLAFDAPPQIGAGLNIIYTALLATCYYAVKAVSDPTALPNAGLARPIAVFLLMEMLQSRALTDASYVLETHLVVRGTTNEARETRRQPLAAASADQPRGRATGGT